MARVTRAEFEEAADIIMEEVDTHELADEDRPMIAVEFYKTLISKLRERINAATSEPIEQDEEYNDEDDDG